MLRQQPKVSLRLFTFGQSVVEFAKKTYLSNKAKDFKGDREFVSDVEARKAFSHFRACIGGLYWWRATHSTSGTGRERMTTEADFAFRQAFAICPSNPEVIFRYTGLLMANDRAAEAVIVAETARSLDPGNPQFQQVLQQINQARKTSSVK